MNEKTLAEAIEEMQERSDSRQNKRKPCLKIRSILHNNKEQEIENERKLARIRRKSYEQRLGIDFPTNLNK